MAKVPGIWRAKSKVSDAELLADRRRTEARLAAIFGLKFESLESLDPEADFEDATDGIDTDGVDPDDADATIMLGAARLEPEADESAEPDLVERSQVRPRPGIVVLGTRDLVPVMAVTEEAPPTPASLEDWDEDWDETAPLELTASADDVLVAEIAPADAGLETADAVLETATPGNAVLEAAGAVLETADAVPETATAADAGPETADAVLETIDAAETATLAVATDAAATESRTDATGAPSARPAASSATHVKARTKAKAATRPAKAKAKVSTTRAKTATTPALAAATPAKAKVATTPTTPAKAKAKPATTRATHTTPAKARAKVATTPTTHTTPAKAKAKAVATPAKAVTTPAKVATTPAPLVTPAKAKAAAAVAAAIAQAAVPPAKAAPVLATPAPTPVATAAWCPSCATPLDPVPTSSRRCTQCRQRIIVKRVDGRMVLLAEAVLPVFEEERRRVANVNRLARDCQRWLRLAAIAGAPAERLEARAFAAVARPSEEAVAASRALYLSTVEKAYQEARRAHRWEAASRIRRDEALVLYREAGSPVPPSETVLKLYREAMAAELRGIAEMIRDAELVAATCCDACRADDRRIVRITAELREASLPHAACPKGLCACRWDLPMRHRATLQRYARRRA